MTMRQTNPKDTTFEQWLIEHEMITKQNFDTFQPEVQSNMQKAYIAWKDKNKNS